MEFSVQTQKWEHKFHWHASKWCVRCLTRSIINKKRIESVSGYVFGCGEEMAKHQSTKQDIIERGQNSTWDECIETFNRYVTYMYIYNTQHEAIWKCQSTNTSLQLNGQSSVRCKIKWIWFVRSKWVQYEERRRHSMKTRKKCDYTIPNKWKMIMIIQDDIYIQLVVHYT